MTKWDRVDILGWVYASIGIGAVMVLVSAVPAWVTHIFHCLDNGQWGFLIAGAIIPPIGVIHGWGLWFGWF